MQREKGEEDETEIFTVPAKNCYFEKRGQRGKKRKEMTFSSEVEDFAESFSMDDEGAVILARMLKEGMQYSSLDLFRNALGDAGLKEIMASLHKNTTVTSITLSIGTQITNYGMDYIAEMLVKNAKLKTLRLFFFRGGLMMEPIIRSLETNESLRELQLWHAALRDDDVLLMAEVMKTNYTLFSFTHDNSCFYTEGLESEIQEYCMRNHLDPWWRVKPMLKAIVLALSPLDLPSYINLEIIDWIPGFAEAREDKKIALIQKMQRKMEEIKEFNQ